MAYTQEEKERALSVDLYQFMLQNYPDDVKMQSKDGVIILRLVKDKYIVIEEGACGARNNKTGSTYDNIGFLGKYYKTYTESAIRELINGDIGIWKHDYSSRYVFFNKNNLLEDNGIAHAKNYDCVMAFLHKTRKLSKDIIEQLIVDRMLFQDVTYNKAVFINKECTCIEIRSTNTFRDPIKDVKRTSPDQFWKFEPKNMVTDNHEPIIVYITKSAIEALSLYEYRDREPAIYVSLGATDNEIVMNKLKRDSRYRIILAMDNSDAGQKFRDKYNELKAIIPSGKDWNEDLKEEIKLGLL